MRRKHGFTLIELLVVISIIAILAAILLPVFAKAREKGKRSKCMSNMRQIGFAIYMYAGDYDECIYPRVYNEGWGDNDTDHTDYEAEWATTDFVTAYMPYLKNLEVFRCPDDGAHGEADWCRYHVDANGIPDRISYMYVGKDIWHNWKPRKITDLAVYNSTFGPQGFLMMDKDWLYLTSGRWATVHGIGSGVGVGQAKLDGMYANMMLFDCSVTWRTQWSVY